MNCSAAQKQLSALVDDELPTNRRVALEAHLSICGPCRARLAALRTVRTRLAAWPTITPSPDFNRGVWEKLAQRQAFQPYAAASLLATGLACLALAALLLLRLINMSVSGAWKESPPKRVSETVELRERLLRETASIVIRPVDDVIRQLEARRAQRQGGPL